MITKRDEVLSTKRGEERGTQDTWLQTHYRQSAASADLGVQQDERATGKVLMHRTLRELFLTSALSTGFANIAVAKPSVNKPFLKETVIVKSFFSSSFYCFGVLLTQLKNYMRGSDLRSEKTGL